MMLIPMAWAVRTLIQGRSTVWLTAISKWVATVLRRPKLGAENFHDKKQTCFGTHWRQNKEEFVDMIIYYFMILAGPGAGSLEIYSRWSHMFQRFPPIDVGDLCVEKRLGTAMVAGVSIATTWWGSADPWSVPCLWWFQGVDLNGSIVWIHWALCCLEDVGPYSSM